MQGEKKVNCLPEKGDESPVTSQGQCATYQTWREEQTAGPQGRMEMAEYELQVGSCDQGDAQLHFGEVLLLGLMGYITKDLWEWVT